MKRILIVILLIIGILSAALWLYIRNYAKKERPLNIIYMISDCFRADRLGSAGYHRDITPFLDELSEKGIRCTNVYSHCSWTFPSMVSHLTGVNPVASYKKDLAISHDLLFISEILQERGYNTYMVSANPLLIERWNFVQGFDVYEYVESDDGRDINLAIQQLFQEELEEPFFLYIHYMDPHIPYYPPEEFLRKVNPSIPRYRMIVENLKHNVLTPEQVRDAIDHYDAEILYQDYLVSQVYNLFKDAPFFHNDLLYVFTADHGDEFTEHGGTGHGVTLYNEVLKVPLIFYGPEVIPGGQVIEYPVQVIDIVPTILDLCRIRYDKDSYEGSGIFSKRKKPFESFAALWKATQSGKNDTTLRSIIQDEWKYIHSFDGNEHKLFNLRNDPGEKNNLIRQFPEIKRKLKGRLFSYYKENAGKYEYPLPADLQTQEDLDIEDRIRALGYVN